MDDSHNSAEWRMTRWGLATAAQCATESIIITDTEGRIRYVNGAFERMTGYSQEEVVGKTPAILKSGEHDEGFYAELWETLRRGQAWRGRLINRAKDDALWYADAVIAPVRDESGEIVGYVATERDVSEELAREEEIRRARRMETIGRLTAGVAHDFNNYMAAIMGYGELAAARMGDAEVARGHVEQICDSARRASSLTRQLLSFGRADARGPQPLDVDAVVSQVRKLLCRLIGEAVELTLDLRAGDARVLGDPGHIEQIVMNLAVNARDAMPRGGQLRIETAEVSVGERDATDPSGLPPGQYFQLLVADTGTGMEDEVRAKIFEPFFTTKAEGEGTGLGLATVYRLVRDAKGHISARSAVGAGTTFRVHFPLTAAAPVAEVAPASADLSRGSETVLLAEDEPIVRDMLGKVLEAQGYTVLACGAGDEALETARQHSGPIELLLTDVVMPRVDGFELFDRLAEQRPEIKVLYMSAYDPSEVSKRGRPREGQGLLEKPFAPHVLARAIREALDAAGN